MKIRFATVVLCLPLLAAIVGCGNAPKPKTTDPVEIEKGRQQEMERSNRELGK